MRMRRVHGQHIHSGLDQSLNPLGQIRRHPHRSTNPETAHPILAGHGEILDFENVFVGNQTHQTALGIHNREFFDFVFLQNPLGLPQGGAFRGCNQVFLGHHLPNRLLGIGFKTQIPVGQNAHQFAVFVHHRNASDTILRHQTQGLFNQRIARKHNRVHNQAALGTLNLADLLGLTLDTHILVNHAEPPVLGNGDGHLKLGDCIHGRRNDGHFEFNIPTQSTGDIDIPG